MSKKKFKAGLESLFGDTGENDQLPGIRPLLVDEEEARESLNTTRRNRPKKRSSKNFTSDLEGLFHNGPDKESNEPRKKSSLASGRDTRVKKRSERPVIGIDALIRRTSMEAREDFDIGSPLKKRLTFSLEKKKIEKLKDIAKSKKSYLKDVVDDIISQYLEERADRPNNAN